MRAKLTGTDAYLEQWRKSEPRPCADDLELAVDQALGELERTFTSDRLRAHVANGGFTPET